MAVAELERSSRAVFTLQEITHKVTSAIEAELAAVGLCKARDCRAVVNFTNACGAVAQSIQNTSWGWGLDRSSTGAQNRALISCTHLGAGCRVAGWVPGLPPAGR